MPSIGHNLNGPPGSDSQSTVWISDAGRIHPVFVKTGISDGTKVQVVNGLPVDADIVLALTSSNNKKTKKTASRQAVSPFMPKRPGSGNKK
jgi:HlyD family secretion protein